MIHFLQSAFQWFYCLPLPAAVALILAATVLFRYLHRLYRNNLWWKTILLLILAAWVGTVIYATVVSREAGHTAPHSFLPFHSYREIFAGGNTEIYRSNFMNVVLFYPAGLITAALLPEKWPWWRRCALTLVLFIPLSAGIEYTQYVCALGRVEADDMIHNSLGALLGSAVGLIGPKTK